MATRLRPENVKYIVIHCSASQPNPKLSIADITHWHRQRGFSTVGYHYVITTNGTVQAGRRLDQVGAHVMGFNSQSVGICLIGGINKQGKSENNFTVDQWVALGELVIQLKERFPNAEVVGHRDFTNVAKDCPCFDVKSWYKETVENHVENNPIKRAETPAVLK